MVRPRKRPVGLYADLSTLEPPASMTDAQLDRLVAELADALSRMNVERNAIHAYRNAAIRILARRKAREEMARSVISEGNNEPL